MGFKPVNTKAIDIKKFKDKPYTGVYLSKKEITTKIGKQTIYSFKDEESNTIFGVYGFTMLNLAMDSVVEGQTIRLTYRGTENVLTKFGQKDVHQVLVEIDEPEEQHD